jgi:hypothetical protein
MRQVDISMSINTPPPFYPQGESLSGGRSTVTGLSDDTLIYFAKKWAFYWVLNAHIRIRPSIFGVLTRCEIRDNNKIIKGCREQIVIDHLYLFPGAELILKSLGSNFNNPGH